MSQQLDMPIDSPEATNYPQMPVDYLSPRPALRPREELGNRLALGALAAGIAGIGAAVLSVLFAPALLVVVSLGAGAMALGFAAGRSVTRGEARSRGLARTGMWLGVAVVATGLVMITLRLGSS